MRAPPARAPPRARTGTAATSDFFLGARAPLPPITHVAGSLILHAAELLRAHGHRPPPLLDGASIESTPATTRPHTVHAAGETSKTDFDGDKTTSSRSTCPTHGSCRAAALRVRARLAPCETPSLGDLRMTFGAAKELAVREGKQRSDRGEVLQNRSRRCGAVGRRDGRPRATMRMRARAGGGRVACPFVGGERLSLAAANRDCCPSRNKR